MFRITTLFLCILLAAASVGRYRAEQAVDKTRDELQLLETGKLDELQKIQVLRAEVAYLENPERLAKIAKAKTDLRPSDSLQIVSPTQFAAALNDDGMASEFADDTSPSDVITNAIAMAQLSTAE